MLWSEAVKARFKAHKENNPFEREQRVSRIANLGSLANIPKPNYEINSHIAVVAGDITELYVDALLCPFYLPPAMREINHSASPPTYPELAARIHSKGGQPLLDELKRSCASLVIGSTTQTFAHGLCQNDQDCPKIVYHTAAPSTEQPDMLKQCYMTAFNQAATDNH